MADQRSLEASTVPSNIVWIWTRGGMLEIGAYTTWPKPRALHAQPTRTFALTWSFPPTACNPSTSAASSLTCDVLQAIFPSGGDLGSPTCGILRTVFRVGGKLSLLARNVT